MDQNSVKYIVAKNILSIGNSTIEFDFPIEESIDVGDMLIVRLEKPFKTIYNENVFGISLTEKKIKWQIAKIKYLSEDCPFIGIEKSDGNLKLYNWCDIYLIVDPITGRILEKSLPMKY
jgi:hypothetical protein